KKRQQQTGREPLRRRPPTWIPDPSAPRDYACYTATFVEQASRLTVIASAAVAAVAHGWLAGWQPSLAPAAFLAFALSFAAARVAFRPALAIVLGTAYIAPALLQLAF